MQQRQLRLGDILDDYCPRERRVTNHAVVAMVGDDVKQTRCTTCEAEHEYKHAKVPRKKKSDTPAALTAQILAGAPKRVTHDGVSANGSGNQHEESEDTMDDMPPGDPLEERAAGDAETDAPVRSEDEASELDREPEGGNDDEGPIHRRLIRASLPRQEGQQPPTRPIPEFTIRQPGGRQNRFRPRHGGGGQGRGQFGHQGGHQGHQFSGGGNRNGSGRGDMRSGRPQGGGNMPRGPRRQGPGPGKRSK